MTPYRLPETLIPGPELATVAQQVRAGEIELDWSDVRVAPEDALAVLLAGCNLVDDADALNLISLADGLNDAVVETLVRGVSFEESDRTVAEADVAYVPEEDTSRPHLAPPNPWELRERLQALVQGELIGPAGGAEEEIDEQRVSDRYLTGVLAPGGHRVQRDADDSLTAGTEDDPEDGATDADTTGPATLFPSSLGLTFSISPQTETLAVTARWGRYERAHSELVTNDDGSPKLVWHRVPQTGTLTLPVHDGLIEPVVPVEDMPEVVLRGRVRPAGGTRLVTLFLINEQREPEKRRDTAWLFQAELEVAGPDGEAVFLPRPHLGTVGEPELLREQEMTDLLYRNYPEFAVGHGIAVHAEPDPDHPDRARRLLTRAAPWYDVPQTDSPTDVDIPALPEIELDMRVLGTLAREELVRRLRPLVAAYRRWIEQQQETAAALTAGVPERFGDAPARALTACRRAADRIEAGIDLLERDDIALDAFHFANRAMALQRVHSIAAERARHRQKPVLSEIDVPANRSWRLFQLAFFLLNLPGLTELDHPERACTEDAVADLLWFPTGGGKTEAYLGLTAYTLALRRLQGPVGGHDGEHGIAVLMRYTLRLLTLQQFQRATTLICACEQLRQDAWYGGDDRWGAEPFRLGLWVGQRTTPNTIDDANEAIKHDRGRGAYRKGGHRAGSPAQLTNCPWCGARISPGEHIKVDLSRGRLLTFCGDPEGQCPFSQRRSPDEGLPVLVVDEEIYRLLPSLLISTVDKFAQMPWKGETQSLFGRVSGRCERHGFRSPDIEDADSHPPRGSLPRARTLPAAPIRPPDLIVQDELHLISGPLGTLTGTYETAIDELCTWQVDGRQVRPKVIASTATVRRAPEQMRGLFLRAVEVFPPQGLDVDDTFFARRRPSTPDHPGRRYLGICAPGRRLKAALIRVYVTYLAAGQTLYEEYGRLVDPWMSLVGYFNSMRELGGARRMVDDDVRSRLRQAEKHGFAIRRSHHVEELTSRKSSTDIPEVLDLLEQVFDPRQEEERKARRKQGIKGLPSPLDVLLATNMLSVGVDVQRLGLMVVGGQPKSTAEYIQATSRVGRRYPGLICTVYNWTRPRDLSHYERFEHYHATFYQQVEALSLTPFSPRARDRSLSALLVTLIRLHSAEFNGRDAAGAIRRDLPAVQRAIETIVRRAAAVTGRPEVGGAVRQELEERLEVWVAEAGDTVGGRRLTYTEVNDDLSRPLLASPDGTEWRPFTALNSLRDVEPEVNLVLDNFRMDQEPGLSPVITTRGAQ